MPNGVGQEKDGKQQRVSLFNRYWGRFNAVHFGIPGDMTQNVIYRLEQGTLDGLSPKLVILLIGTNNGSDGVAYSLQDTANGIAAVVKVIRERSPKSKVLLMGVFPRGTAPEGLKKIKDLNAILATLDDGKTVRFMDIGDKLAPNGVPTRDIQPDLLHLNWRGYDIWAQAIQPVVLETFGRPMSEALPPLYMPVAPPTNEPTSQPSK